MRPGDIGRMGPGDRGDTYDNHTIRGLTRRNTTAKRLSGSPEPAAPDPMVWRFFLAAARAVAAELHRRGRSYRGIGADRQPLA
jgi:hypothetical protein